MVPTQIVMLLDHARRPTPPLLPTLRARRLRRRAVRAGGPAQRAARGVRAGVRAALRAGRDADDRHRAARRRPRGRARGRPSRAAGVGRLARPGVDVRVLDDDDVERRRPTRSARSCVRGPAVMRGYWHRPEASAETLRNGWLHTGDLGRIDEHGYLYLLDRAKDMIITGGSNVYAVEVEAALVAHPAVHEVAVVGVPTARGARSSSPWSSPPTATRREPALDRALPRRARGLQAAPPLRVRRRAAPQRLRQGAQARAARPLPLRSSWSRSIALSRVILRTVSSSSPARSLVMTSLVSGHVESRVRVVGLAR